MSSSQIQKSNDSLQFSAGSQENKSFIKEYNSAISKGDIVKQPSDNLKMSNSIPAKTIKFNLEAQIIDLNITIKQLKEKIVSLENENKSLNEKLNQESLNRKKTDEEIKLLKYKVESLTNENNELRLSTELTESQKHLDSSLKLRNMNSVNDLSNLLESNISEEFKKAKSSKISKSNLKKDFINLKQRKEKQSNINEDKIKKENENKIKKIISEENMERSKQKHLSSKIIDDLKKNHNNPEHITNDNIKKAFITNQFDENKAADSLLINK
jgi:hypothetical protein